MRAWIVLLLLLAGCASDETAPAEAPPVPVADIPPANTTAPPPAPPVTLAFTLADCLQLHALFSVPAEDFDAMLPPGFEIDDPDSDGMVDLIVLPTLCAAGALLDTPGIEFGMDIMALPVVPPSDPGDDRIEWLAISALVQHDGIFAALANVGAAVEPGELTLQDDGVAGAKVAVWRAAGATASHSERTTTSPGQGSFDALSARFWLVKDLEVVGVLHWDQEEAADDGMGSAVFTNVQGSGDAPPAYPGLAHRVRDFAATVVYVPAGQLAWFTP